MPSDEEKVQEPKPGANEFTYVDPGLGLAHTVVPGDVEALESGEGVKVHAHTVFGPPAFGSPNPETLGNSLHVDHGTGAEENSEDYAEQSAKAEKQAAKSAKKSANEDEGGK